MLRAKRTKVTLYRIKIGGVYKQVFLYKMLEQERAIYRDREGTEYTLAWWQLETLTIPS